mmetsp:Transcript_16470/g.50545  ORF Transcript_16470/g.50545 Transcript_16470/m.50545 type:complete len:180 (-) Transcript_16470:668-1207(-)
MANGHMRALGTSVHLKNALGDGYEIELALVPNKSDQVDAFVRSIIPEAELATSFSGVLTYKVRRDSISLPTLFMRMDSRPSRLGILDWGLRQASLEDIFLQIAARAEEESIAERQESARLASLSSTNKLQEAVRNATRRLSSSSRTAKRSAAEAFTRGVARARSASSSTRSPQSAAVGS